MLVSQGIIQELVSNALHASSGSTKKEVRQLICKFTMDSKEATHLLNALIR